MGAREVQRRRGSGEAPLLGRGCGKEDTRGLKPRNNAAELVARHVAGALLKVRRQHDKNPQLTPPQRLQGVALTMPVYTAASGPRAAPKAFEYAPTCCSL